MFSVIINSDDKKTQLGLIECCLNTLLSNNPLISCNYTNTRASLSNTRFYLTSEPDNLEFPNAPISTKFSNFTVTPDFENQSRTDSSGLGVMLYYGDDT